MNMGPQDGWLVAVVIALLATGASPAGEGIAPVFGQDEAVASSRLRRVGEGVVSTGGGEAFPALSPDGNVLFFATHVRGWTGFRLWVSNRLEDGWSRPEPLPFWTGHNDRSPFLAADGSTLFFASDRPLPGEAPGRHDFNLWRVRREGTDGWAVPEPVPGVNSEADDFHPSLTAGGDLFFSSNRDGGLGSYDLYVARPAGDGYRSPANLGGAINTSGEETDVYVAPDERFIILVATDRPGGHGGDDLWLSLRGSGGWGEPANLGSPVNSEAYDYGPFISPDRSALYFTTHRWGLGEIVCIPLDDVPLLARSFDR